MREPAPTDSRGHLWTSSTHRRLSSLPSCASDLGTSPNRLDSRSINTKPRLERSVRLRSKPSCFINSSSVSISEREESSETRRPFDPDRESDVRSMFLTGFGSPSWALRCDVLNCRRERWAVLLLKDTRDAGPNYLTL